MAARKSQLAKVKDEVTEAKQEFIPSNGDEDYLKQKPSDMDPETQIEILADLADDINTGYETAINIARKATGRMIIVGQDLLKAREFFKGDLEFGRWRKANINFSQSHCARLMQVTREFGDNSDALKLPIGTLSELCSASNAIKDATVAKVKSGEKVTKAEVSKAKKEEKAETEDSSPPEVDKVKLNDTDNKPKVEIGGVMKAAPETPEARADKWLALPVLERITGLEVRGKHAEPIVDAFLMFGIPPFHEGLPSIDSINLLWHGISVVLDGESPELMDKLTVAYDFITELY